MAKIDDAINTLTPDELSILNSDPQLVADFKKKYGEEKTSLLSKARSVLAMPEQKSREGLNMIANAIPGGEHVGTGVLGTASNAAKALTESLAEVAPGFISPGSILTAGALKGAKLAAPIIKGAGSLLAKGSEAISGLEYKTPGILTAAAKNPGLIFGPGRQAAGEKFAEVINKASIRPAFGRATSPKELLDVALKAGDEGNLTPEEALIARQTLDGIKKTIPRYSYNEMRAAFDAVAKNITTKADAAYSLAVKSEALRQLFPQNKLGGTSIAKGILGILGGGAPLVAMSPIAQGSIASLLGLAAKGGSALAQTPIQSGGAIGELLQTINRYRNRPLMPGQP